MVCPAIQFYYQAGLLVLSITYHSTTAQNTIQHADSTEQQNQSDKESRLPTFETNESKIALIITCAVLSAVLLCFFLACFQGFRIIKREQSSGPSEEAQRVRQTRIELVAKERREDILETILNCRRLPTSQDSYSSRALTQSSSEDSDPSRTDPLPKRKTNPPLSPKSVMDAALDVQANKGELSDAEMRHCQLYCSLPSDDEPEMNTISNCSSDLEAVMSNNEDDEQECAICLCPYGEKSPIQVSDGCSIDLFLIHGCFSLRRRRCYHGFQTLQPLFPQGLHFFMA